MSDAFKEAFWGGLVPHQDLARNPAEMVADCIGTVLAIEAEGGDWNVVEDHEVEAFVQWMRNNSKDLQRQMLTSLPDGYWPADLEAFAAVTRCRLDVGMEGPSVEALMETWEALAEIGYDWCHDPEAVSFAYAGAAPTPTELMAFCLPRALAQGAA